MKLVLLVFVAVMAFAASARFHVTDGVDSRETAPVPVAAPVTARILGGLADGTPPPPAPAKPAFVVPAKDVISTKTIQQGGRTLTIQRIQPIPLPPPPPAPAPETLDQAASLEQDAEVSEPQPKWDFLMVGATVFRFKDSPSRTMVTYWPSGMGESVTLWSSADFGLLNGFTDFVAADGHAFSMMLMLSDADPDTIAELQAAEEPEIADFPIGKATFAVTGDAPADAQVLAPIAALHEIYNHEHPRLLLAWEGRERARSQREAELQANPPQAKAVTIRYWLKGGREVPPPPPDPTSAPPPRPATRPNPRRPRSWQGSRLRLEVVPRPASEPPLPTELGHHSRGKLPILLLICFLHQFFTLPARAILDRNGNGVSDIWELDTNQQNLFTNFNADDDDDADGWSNGAEAIAGTPHDYPHPPLGRFEPACRIAPAVYQTLPDGSEGLVTAESFVLTWTGQIGKLYSLQWADDLSSGYWITLGCLLCDGTPMEGGRPVEVSSNAYFRIAITDYDEDTDGLTNWEEHRLGTNPALDDSDSDAMPDGW